MPSFSGVYAALLTPRTIEGDLDLINFERQLNSPIAGNLTGYAINGATAEFTFSTEDELRSLLRATFQVIPNAEVLCGIGSCDVRGAVARGRIAAEAGAAAVLLPMPSFFPYRQDDLRSFTMAVADAVELPVLLYNLPQFTSGLDPETSLALIREHDNIIGIKDSSGSLDTLRAITDAELDCARIIGNDSALRDAMSQGLCDGVVSGVACTLPELMTELFASLPGSPAFKKHSDMLDEFIAHLGALPTPWGLKVTSAVRGFTRESYPFPLSEQRAVEIEHLRTWFSAWMDKATTLKAVAA